MRAGSLDQFLDCVSKRLSLSGEGIAGMEVRKVCPMLLEILEMPCDDLVVLRITRAIAREESRQSSDHALPSTGTADILLLQDNQCLPHVDSR